jgi:hypothetical protein
MQDGNSTQSCRLGFSILNSSDPLAEMLNTQTKLYSEYLRCQAVSGSRLLLPGMSNGSGGGIFRLKFVECGMNFLYSFTGSL